MSIKIKASVLAMAVPILGIFASVSAFADDCPYYESRSGLCGYYKSEISSAQAYLKAVASKKVTQSNGNLKPVIIDVRSVTEYKAGHPDGSYNVPYPYVYQTCDAKGRHPDGACKTSTGLTPQTDQAFLDFVKEIAPDPNTPIYTLCRTGVRSVGAANVLALAGYKKVSNIWEGFVGVNFTYKDRPLDLNHSGSTVGDYEDLNGWRYFQGLPYDDKLEPELMYNDPAHPGIYELP